MKVLAMAGSPRKGGNTDILAEEFLKGAAEAGAETEKVYLDDFRIRPIGEVGDVIGKREDVRADDDFLEVFERFLAADVILFATPVYWQGVSAQTKCFLDRLSCYIRKDPYDKRIRGKRYAVVTTFGAPDAGHWVAEPLKVGIHFLGGTYIGDVSIQVYKKADVLNNPSALTAARELGRKATGGIPEDFPGTLSPS